MFLHLQNCALTVNLSFGYENMGGNVTAHITSCSIAQTSFPATVDKGIIPVSGNLNI